MKTVASRLALFLSFFWVPFWVNGQSADSVAVAQQVDSLIQVSRDLTSKRDFDNALGVIVVAEKIALEKLGRESAAYGSCAHNHSKVFYFKRDLPESEKWCLEAMSIREKVLGKEHPDYAASLNNLANIYLAMDNYEKAEPLHLEAKAIREKVLGKEHPDYAASLNNLANLYFDKEEYGKAEPLYVEAKTIREKILGKEHSDYFTSLFNLANLYTRKADYDRAESMYLEAKSIKEKVAGKERPEYALILQQLATLYFYKGEYEKAEHMYIETQSICEKVMGKANRDYAICIGNLATLYSSTGDYDRAETLMLETKSIIEKVMGKENPDYAACLQNLAIHYSGKGDFKKAESLYLEAKSIEERVSSKESLDYAGTLIGLADLYKKEDDYGKVETLYLEAKAITEKVLGKEHPEYAESLNNLALWYWLKGDFNKAEPLYWEAQSIKGKVLGKHHSSYAAGLDNLGLLYRDKADYEKAESFHLQAKAIRETVFGKESESYSESLYNLAILYQTKSDFAKTGMYLVENNPILKNILQKATAYNTDQDMLRILEGYEVNFDALLFIAQLHPTDSLLTAAYDNALFFSNTLLDAALSLEKNIARADSATRELHSDLKSARFQLNNWYSRPIAERDSAIVADLEEKANSCEKELRRRSPAFVEARREVEWREVRDRLRPGEAAIEFINYRFHNARQATDSTMYSALVLLPGEAVPHFVPLFEERQLTALLDRHGMDEGLVIRDIYYNNKDLYRLLLAPLVPLLADVRTVYFAPSGLVHQLNPAALEDENNQWVAENRSWVRLGSTRELVTRALADRSFARDGAAPATATVLGGIQYELEGEPDSLAFAAANPMEAVDTNQIQFRKDGQFRYIREAEGSGAEEEELPLPGRVRGAGDDDWKYLPATRLEADETAQVLETAGFRVKKLGGYEASEERLKKPGGPSPRILHFATHGFTYPDPKKQEASRPSLSGDQQVFKLSDNPMLRSGLLLAGANFYWKNRRPLANRDDGILVAYEVRDLDLQGTELAVLSACQTGLGQSVGSEGLYGLQRAFKIAGAKFLIVSLWQVPDEQTREMMQVFYQKWAAEGLPLRTAFERAQAEMRGKYRDPYLWAGFVLVE